MNDKLEMDKPYYQDDWVTIYHGDCREILPELPKVDLVLTDPPYGIGLDYNEYEDSPENLVELIKTVLPMLRGMGKRVLLTSGVLNQWLYPQPDWVLAWIIPTTNSGSSKWGFSCWQPILAYGDDPYLTNGLGRRMDTITGMSKRLIDYDHPCPKPLDIWKKIILRASVSKEDIILDPFLGVGTTVVASKELNRKCIGIEIEEHYCEIAANRCRQGVFNLT